MVRLRLTVLVGGIEIVIEHDLLGALHLLIWLTVGVTRNAFLFEVFKEQTQAAITQILVVAHLVGAVAVADEAIDRVLAFVLFFVNNDVHLPKVLDHLHLWQASLSL